MPTGLEFLDDSEDSGRRPPILAELAGFREQLDGAGDFESVLEALSLESREVLLDFRCVYGICQDIRQNFYLSNRSVPEGLIAGYVHYRNLLAASLSRSCGWGEERTAAVMIASEHLITGDWRAVAVEIGGAPVRDALVDCPESLLYHSLAEMERITRLAASDHQKKTRFRQRWGEVMHVTRSSGKCLKDLVAAMEEALSSE